MVKQAPVDAAEHTHVYKDGYESALHGVILVNPYAMPSPKEEAAFAQWEIANEHGEMEEASKQWQAGSVAAQVHLIKQRIERMAGTKVWTKEYAKPFHYALQRVFGLAITGDQMTRWSSTNEVAVYIQERMPAARYISLV